MLTTLDPALHETFNVYNADNELISTTVGYGSATPATTQYSYDGDGDRTPDQVRLTLRL